MCYHDPASPQLKGKMRYIQHCIPVSFPCLHITPPKSPSAAVGGSWCEAFVCGPVLCLPKGAFCCSCRKGDHLPMPETVKAGRRSSPETTPSAGSHLVPALCSWRVWKAPHSSVCADALAPCLHCAWHVPGVTRMAHPLLLM